MSVHRLWKTKTALGLVLAACLVALPASLEARAAAGVSAPIAGSSVVAAVDATDVPLDAFGVVDIPDPAVRAAIEHALNGAPLTAENLAALGLGSDEGLVIEGAQSLEGLQHLTSLRALSISGGDLSAADALAPLAGMSSLERLSIQRAGVTSVSGIRALAGLTSLDLSSNRLQSLEGLGELHRLEWLRLDGNGLSNGTPGLPELGGLVELRDVDLSTNELTSLLSLFGDGADSRERLIDWIATVHAHREGAPRVQGVWLEGQFAATGEARPIDDVEEVIALLGERGVVPTDYGPLFFDPPRDIDPPVEPSEPAPPVDEPAPGPPTPELPAPEQPGPEQPAPETPGVDAPGEPMPAPGMPGEPGESPDLSDPGLGLDPEVELEDAGPDSEADADAEAEVGTDAYVGEASAVSSPIRLLGAGLVIASAFAAGIGIWIFVLLRRRRRQDEVAPAA